MEHFFKKFLPALLVAVGAFSGEADALCAGTVRFKPPVDWTEAYFGTRNCSPAEAGHTTAIDADGYFTFDLSNIGHQETDVTNFSILSSVTQGNIFAISRTGWAITAGSVPPYVAFTNNAVFPCPGVGNTVYIQDNPLSPGTTYIGSNPALAKYLYVLVPEDKDWQSDVMMVSTDGGVTGTKMEIAPGMCGWYRMIYEADKVPYEVLIYRKNDPDNLIGQNGLWGSDAEPAPLPLKPILEAFATNALYFIPDDAQWNEGTEDQMGLFLTDPGVDGVCSFNLAALIYDTDQSLNPLFTSDGDNSGFGACTGVRHGIVKQDLGPNNKPVFNTGNENATLCAGDEAKFNTLFNYTAGVNEVQCYDMPFRHYGTDTRWGFDSDSAASLFGGYSGFHPLENSTDATVVTSISPKPCPACRYKRLSEGPVPVVYGGDFDKYCNTYGWEGGIDCEGLFYNGEYPAVWDWSAPRWESTHNQQFCFESHATFTYHEDQEFSIRGGDDIWVFINKKLALDNGGAHLAAPGHVVLKNLNNIYGPTFLEPGKDYSLDIFYCDRRTTMSDLTIKTNMSLYNRGYTGLSANATDNGDGSVSYGICFDQSGFIDCAGLALGSWGGSATVHACGAEIGSKVGKTLKYSITTRAGEPKATLNPGASGWQYGGFDLSDPFSPKVNKSKINGLAPGSYRLVIDMCDASGACDAKARTYINFRIQGNLDVMTQNSTYTVNAGDERSAYYASGTKWTYWGTGVAGGRVPLYISAFADGGVDLLAAVGQSYSLTLSSGLSVYRSPTGTGEVVFPKTIGPSGIDTVWVYMDPEQMTASPLRRRVTLKSSAAIDFYATEEEYVLSAQTVASPKFKMTSVRRDVYISGVESGKAYLVFDIQGRLVKRGVFASSSAVLHMPHAGTYLVRIGGWVHRVQVK